MVAADHLIPDAEEFAAAVRAALPAAAAGSIVTFGVEADLSGLELRLYPRPAAQEDGGPVRKVGAFVEKPDAATAARYVADGYLWNSGNFMFRAEVMLRELGRLEPEIRKAAKGAVDNLTSDLDFYRLAEAPFAQAPKKSIDYAVMERTELAAVLPVSFRWSDVGSWNAVWDAQPQDEAGNVIEGPGGGDRHPQQPDPFRGHRAHHRDRPRRRDRHRHRRRRAGGGAAAGGKGQGPRRAAQGEEPHRGAGAPPRLPPVGLLPERGQSDRATRSSASA